MGPATREVEGAVGERKEGRPGAPRRGGPGSRAGRACDAPAVHGGVQARILREVEACTQPGEIGALLRREGLYSSLLASGASSATPGRCRRWSARGGVPATGVRPRT